MAFDAHKNLAISAVVTAPTPATSGTTMTVTAGEGARFPTPPFNATVWPSTAMPTPLNGEVIRVTGRTTDTLTITRAQEGSTARTIGSGDLIAATITAKTLTDLETRVALKDEANVFTTSPQQIGPVNNPALSLMDSFQPVDARVFRIMDSAQQLQFGALNDAQSAFAGVPLTLTRPGDAVIGRDVYEKGRLQPLGDWVFLADDPGSFTAMPAGTFTINAHLVRAYTRIGRMLMYSFYLNASIGGTPTYLRIALPSGIVSVNYAASVFMWGTSPGMIQCAPGDTFLNLYRDPTGGNPFVAGTYYLIGTLPLATTQ